jgi:hypothetical protein
MSAFWCSTIRCRERLQMRSDRIGLRLYAIADEPICVDSNGSSTSCIGNSQCILISRQDVHGNLEVRKQPQIRSNFMRGRPEARERRECINVYFTGVCLRGDGVGIAEAAQLRHELVEFLNLYTR